MELESIIPAVDGLKRALLFFFSLGWGRGKMGMEN